MLVTVTSPDGDVAPVITGTTSPLYPFPPTGEKEIQTPVGSTAVPSISIGIVCVAAAAKTSAPAAPYSEASVLKLNRSVNPLVNVNPSEGSAPIPTPNEPIIQPPAGTPRLPAIGSALELKISKTP